MRMRGVARIERGAGRAGDLDPLAGGEILDYAVEILQRRRRDRAEVEQLGTPLSNVIVGWIAPVPTVESNPSNEPGVLSISKEMVLAAVASTAPWMSSLPPLALIVPWPVSVALAAMVPNIVSTAPAPSSWIMPFEMFSAAPIVSRSARSPMSAGRC